MSGKIMCILRKNFFLCLDQLKGGTVKRTYKRLKTFESLSSNSPQILNHQKTTLKSLLEHATATTEFYSAFKGKKLEDFPVIDKEKIRSQQGKFMSNNYRKDQLTTMYTSGSTGTPFCCYQDKKKRKHVIAELIFYSENAGYELGSPLMHIMGKHPNNKRSRLKQWVNNHRVVLVSNYNDSSIRKIIKEINSSPTLCVLGYASTFDSLNEYFSKNGTTMVSKKKVKGIISNGQILFDNTRESVEKAFNCRCYSRYSNEENGILGIDGIENNVFMLNEANYIFEILKIDKEEPVKDGEIGRIVLTDLYNYAMPMIRYDTGDIGSIRMLNYKNKMKKSIDNFGGRRMDMVYDCNGNIIYPHLIADSFEGFSKIKQFQFIQEEKKKYRLKLNTHGGSIENEKLKDIVKSFLGDEAQLTLEVVDEIPILESGKRKMVINRMI